MPGILPHHVRQPGGGFTPPAGPTSGQSLVWVGPKLTDLGWSTISSPYVNIGAVFDGASSNLASGAFVDVPIPYACTVILTEMLLSPSGSLVVATSKATYAAYPVFTPIDGTAPITVASAVKSQNSVLTGWTTSLAAGDILRFTISTITPLVNKATVLLKVQK